MIISIALFAWTKLHYELGPGLVIIRPFKQIVVVPVLASFLQLEWTDIILVSVPPLKQSVDFMQIVFLVLPPTGELLSFLHRSDDIHTIS